MEAVPLFFDKNAQVGAANHAVGFEIKPTEKQVRAKPQGETSNSLALAFVSLCNFGFDLTQRSRG